MTDREYLCWLHARLEHVHGENKSADYMHKLRSIIAATPQYQITPNIGHGKNSLEKLRKSFETAADIRARKEEFKNDCKDDPKPEDDEP